MPTYCVLHIFVALLLCDYGMFSTNSSLSKDNSTVPSIVSNAEISMTTTVKSITQFKEDITTHKELTIDDIYTDDEENSGTDTTDPVQPIKTSSLTEHPKLSTEGREERTAGVIITDNSGQYTAGVIILIFILILIVILIAILYFLRKKGRSYSFDLTRASCPANDYDTPLRSVEQQALSYEHTDKDLPVCLDYVQEDKSQEKIANGCTGENTEQKPATENEMQNVPEEFSFSSSSSSFSPPMKKVEFNLDLDLIERDSEPNSPTAAEASDTPQNENNNDVTNAEQSGADFTEINLDELKEHV